MLSLDFDAFDDAWFGAGRDDPIEREAGLLEQRAVLALGASFAAGD
jgi:hypothetical protein